MSYPTDYIVVELGDAFTYGGGYPLVCYFTRANPANLAEEKQ